MKTVLLLLLLATTLTYLSGQNSNINSRSNPNLLKVDDQYFQSNLKGLGMLMTYLDTTDSLSYQYLKDDYDNLLRNNKKGLGIIGGGIIGGGLIMAIGVASPDQLLATSLLGCSVMVTSAIIARSNLVYQDDILNFINQYNAFSKKHNILITYKSSFDSFQGLAGGFSLKINF